MAMAEQKNSIIELQKWAEEALDLLDEVKPYRSVFYKQRVARLKHEFEQLSRTQIRRTDCEIINFRRS